MHDIIVLRFLFALDVLNKNQLFNVYTYVRKGIFLVLGM